MGHACSGGSLYKNHGTCLKGMLVEGRIDKGGAEDFLHAVHLIDYSDVLPDATLRLELSKVKVRLCALRAKPEEVALFCATDESTLRVILSPTPRPNPRPYPDSDPEPCAHVAQVPMWIFTASTSEHATRCMDRVGVVDLPWRGIIDTRTCKLETKHSRSSFEAAMAAAGVSEPSACVFCDDSVKNINAAKEVGWRTVLVGLTDCNHRPARGSNVLRPMRTWRRFATCATAVPELFS